MRIKGVYEKGDKLSKDFFDYWNKIMYETFTSPSIKKFQA